jgi:glutaredoxin-like protein NrdH
MNMTHVDGDDRGSIRLFALSTCGWCRKTKKLLGDLGVAYDYIDVDLVTGDEQDKVMDEVRRYNPRCNFPTLVIGEDRCVIGFNEEETREALGL